MDRVLGVSPTGISVRTTKLIASTKVIELLSGFTAITSLPSGDTETAEAERGRLRGTTRLRLIVETSAADEIVETAVGSIVVCTVTAVVLVSTV
jgi:hypothetical protein